MLSLLLSVVLTAGAQTARDRAVPHYDHIILILEENRGLRSIIGSPLAPALTAFAHDYGSATNMFAERHPSEPNYVALLGGDTFGIADDDSWYCDPYSDRPNCKGSDAPGFVSHLIPGPNLATQLAAKGLSWRAYLEDLPAPGSLAIFSAATTTRPAALYAAKHTGFTNFATVHDEHDLADKLVGFERLHADLQRGTVPAFALIVPNQCNEMHGINSPLSPDYCRTSDGLIRRGDDVARGIVAEIQGSKIWTHGNTAIVITWDENDDAGRNPALPQSCCVHDAKDPGGGQIPTLVITNHGPRGLADPTPYDHYSLLRTIEDALGLGGYLRHAGDATVLPMTPLFGGS